MKVTTIDRTSLRMINSDINNAIQAVAVKYGVSIKTANSSFSSSTATTKVVISVIGENGIAKSPESIAFNSYKDLYGIKKNIGDTFRHNGDFFTIQGLAPRSSKYPIIATNAEGKSYKFSIKATQ